MAKENVRVVVFNDEQGWCTVASEVNTKDLCIDAGKLDYHCHCWSWKLKTWDGTELKPCTIHSGVVESKDPIHMYQISEFIEPPLVGEWAAFYSDGTCYDLCWLNTKEAREEIATQASLAREVAANDIDQLKPYSTVLKPEEIEKSHKEFLSIVDSIASGKKKLVSLMQNVVKIKTTANRFEKEPLYVSYKKILRKAENDVINLYGVLFNEYKLGHDAILSNPDYITMIQVKDKAEEKLKKWTSQIGQAETKKTLDNATSAYEAIAAQVSELSKNIARDCIPYFYDVLEGYINTKDMPTLHKKYKGYLEVYEQYLPRKYWVKSYRDRFKQKGDNEGARKAMSTASLASKMSTASVIKTNIVVGEHGNEINEHVTETVIAGGSMLGLSSIYKPTTPVRTQQVKSPERQHDSRGTPQSYRGRGRQTH